MNKLKLDQFLQAQNMHTFGKSLPQEPSVRDAGFLSLLTDLNEHVGYYQINQVLYDYVLYSGNDSLYFCSGFNANSGRVTDEILFVISSTKVSKISDNTYALTEFNGDEHLLTFRSPCGEESKSTAV